jgi:PKD repeat protein
MVMIEPGGDRRNLSPDAFMSSEIAKGGRAVKAGLASAQPGAGDDRFSGMGDLRRRLRAVVVVAVMAGASAFAPGAGATTFCVSDPGCVSAGGTSEPDLTSAFTAASSDAAPPSNVKIGPGNYGIGSLVFNKPSQLTVIGAGRGQTVLTTSGGGLAVSGNSSDLVTSLSLRGTGFGASQLLSLGGGTADGVDVNLDAPGTAGVAVFGSGTVKNSSVTVTGDADATAIGFETGPSIVQDTTLTGPEGLTSAGVTIMQRDRVSASNFGAECRSTCVFEDSLISLSSGASEGLLIDCLGTSVDLSATNLTIVGPAAASVAARCAGGGTAHAAIDSSILRGAVLHTLQASTTGSTSHAEIDPTYDAYDPSTSSASGPGATITGPGADSINADPLFIDPAAGDYRIPFNSPAVNAGNPAVLGLLDSTTDLAGQPRVVGGRRDVGAFEYQHQPPTASIAQDLTSVITGQPVTFTGAASSDPDPGDTLSYSWSFDDGASASTSTVHHAFATPGTHVVHLTVVDPTGLSASASASVHVTALTLSGLTQSHVSWTLGKGLATVTRKPKPKKVPIGTTFTFELNAAATVRLVFTHTFSGVLTHSSCVRRTKANRKRPRCTRTLTDGTLVLPATPGTNRVHFEGRLDPRHTLKPGRYTVTATAFDAAGHPTSPLKLTFTIVKRPPARK